jgi:ubiquinone/menaquinone biosynthesis C-methylase UbiE
MSWAASRALDDADDVEVALRWLRAVAELSPVREGKRRSYELLALQPGQWVLDIGCGDGGDLAALEEFGARAVGVDASESAVRAARAAVPSAQVEVADAVALPFAPDTFDACRCDRTLQHVADPAGALAEMVRVTRPGGVVVVCERRHRSE